MPPPPPPVIRYTKWSLFQKSKLLRLLREYPLDAYESIACHFTNKDAQQVEEYIRKLKAEVRNKKVVRKVAEEVLRIPLEDWLFVAKDLVDFENVDCSANLQKVMTIISKFEDFKEVKTEGDNGPNYGSIYKYLAQILGSSKQEDVVQLGPLESAIMLDMIHSLMDVLTQHDTSVQRNVMKWKYRLMTYRHHKKIIPEILRKASENDFEELISEMRQQKYNEENRKTIVSSRTAEINCEKFSREKTKYPAVSNYRKPKHPNPNATRVTQLSCQDQVNELDPNTSNSKQNNLRTLGHKSVPENHTQPSTSTQQKPQHSTSTVQKPQLSTSSVHKPQPSTSTQLKPQPSTSTQLKPQHSTSTIQKPQPSTSTQLKPQHSTSTVQKSQPSTSTQLKPQPSTSTQLKPQPSTSSVQKPHPSTSTQQMPQPSTSTVQKTQPSTSGQTMVEPSTSSTSEAPFTATLVKQPSSSTVVDLTNTSSLIDKIPAKKTTIPRHKPGRKGPKDEPEIPRTEVYLVMPPKGVKIVNYSVRNKKNVKNRLDGKYQTMSNEKSVVDESSRNVTYDLHESIPEKAVCITSVIKSEAEKYEKKRQLEREADEKYDELMSVHDEESRKKPLKKPKLYSINPFCLPVSLIDLNSSKIE